MKNPELFSLSSGISLPSFLTGMGSVLNIGGNYYSVNSSENNQEANLKSLTSDWEAIGKDMEIVLLEVLDSSDTK